MRRLLCLLLAAGCSEAGVEGVPDAGFPDAQPFVDAPPRIDARVQPDAPPPDAGDPPPRYPSDRTLSPITPSVARNLEAIVLRGDTLHDDVFAKVGDSITVATQFLNCFNGNGVDLGGRTDLQGTIDHFKLGTAGTTTPWDRTSLAATVGWSAHAVLDGSPNPLEKETGAIQPRYAVVMFGSNDAAQTPTYVYTFGPILLDIVDRLASQGIIPIMSTIPPNTQSATVGARVPFFNAVIRGIAQARQLPLMDFGKEMAALPMSGLGGDGLHPNSFPGGACKLTPDGLGYGYNVRNLLALQSLDRARSVVEGDPPPDPPAAQPAVRGEGTYAVPFEVNSLPWSDMHDTSLSTNTISAYTGCSATQNESGPEYVYRMVVDAPVKVRAMVLDDTSVDIDLHLLSGGTTADKCVQRNDKEIIATLAAGTHYFVLDTFVPAAGGPQEGEYLFVVMEEPAP